MNSSSRKAGSASTENRKSGSHGGPAAGTSSAPQRVSVQQESGSHGGPAAGTSPTPQRVSVQQVKRRTIKISLPRNYSYTRMDLAEALRQVHFPLSQVEALGTRQQNHQWFLTVKKEEEAADLLSEGVLLVNGKTGFISTLDDTTHRVRIHWAPYHLSQPVLTAALEAALPLGASIVQTGFEKSMVKGMEHVSTLVRFAVISFSGPSANLPHLLKVQQVGESFECLLTIQGRKPICLRCKQVGHVRSECVSCHICKSNNHISSNCPHSVNRSYANILSNRQNSSEDGGDDFMEVGEGMAEGGDRVPPEASLEPVHLPKAEDFPPLDEVTLAINQVRSEVVPDAPVEDIPEEVGQSHMEVQSSDPAVPQQTAEQQVVQSQGPRSSDTQRQAVPPGQGLRRDSTSGEEDSLDSDRLIISSGQSPPQEEATSGEEWLSPKRRKKQKKSHDSKVKKVD